MGVARDDAADAAQALARRVLAFLRTLDPVQLGVLVSALAQVYAHIVRTNPIDLELAVDVVVGAVVGDNNARIN